MYFRTSSSSPMRPAFTRSAIDAAVNCFETDPVVKRVAGVIGMSWFRFAKPYPREKATWPSL